MLQCNVSCQKNNLIKKSKNHIKQHCPPKNGKNHTVFLIKNVAEYYLKCQYRYATNQYNLSHCPHTPHPISITRAGVLSLFYYEIFKIRQFFFKIYFWPYESHIASIQKKNILSLIMKVQIDCPFLYCFHWAIMTIRIARF